MFKRILLIVSCVSIVLISTPPLCAQGTGVENEFENARRFRDVRDHEFLDVDDEVLVVGQFKELAGATVKIFSDEGKHLEFRLVDFSAKDQKFIKRLAATAKKNEKYKKDTLKILETMQTVRDESKLAKLCKRIRNMGPAAKAAEGAMRGFFARDDDRLKRASMLAYMAVCDVTIANYKELTDEMADDTWQMRDAFLKRPKEFVNALVRFEEFSFPYLQHAAYTGRLKLKSGEPSIAAPPVEFKDSSSTKNKIREAAVLAIGQIDDEEGANILLDLLPVVEKPVSGKRDDRTLKAIIKSFGRIGESPDSVLDALERLKGDFPEEVAEALELLDQDD